MIIVGTVKMNIRDVATVIAYVLALLSIAVVACIVLE